MKLKVGFESVLSKKTQNTLMPKLKRLSEKHWTTIDMKWKGFAYREIAEKLGVSLDTVKSWFRKNGLLSAHYKDYAEDQIIKHEREKHTKTH